MAEAELDLWTPVALDLGGAAPSIDWGDLSGVRFAEPFLHQTIERWAGADPAPLVRTGLDRLAALDDRPSLDPTALIFHLSRCGSTLLSRLLGTLPGVLVVSEPAPLNTLLCADPAALGLTETARLLRLLVRALGRRRFGDERHYVLKLSSWNVRRHALFRRAFPDAAVVWLQRAPAETAASLLADPPGWLELRREHAAACDIFGIDAPEAGIEAFCVQALTALLEAAGAIDGEVLLLDYGELPDAAWTCVAPYLGLRPGPADIARMREMARFQAKEPALRPFTRAAPHRDNLPQPVRALLANAAQALYRELDRRRREDGDGRIGTGRDFAARARL